MSNHTTRTITDSTVISDDATYVVVGIDKSDRSEREMFTGSYDECEEYAERNDSPDNFERYEVREIAA